MGKNKNTTVKDLPVGTKKASKVKGGDGTGGSTGSGGTGSSGGGTGSGSGGTLPRPPAGGH